MSSDDKCAGRAAVTWFTHHEHGGFATHRAAVGAADLSVMHIGSGWSWLVRRAGADVAEGTADSLAAAREAAIAAARTEIARLP
jgi:hypothetical protein